ncbi:hypothetical protein CR513_31870, partial [Mucuna pruriens]
MDCEVLEGLYKCIDRLSENDEFVDHIHNELPIYKRAGGMFGFPAAVRKRTTMAPVGELDEEGEDAEDELVFDDDVLTWRDVASATGAAEPLKYTRRQTQMQRTVVASTSNKEKGKGVVEEEDAAELNAEANE